MPNYNFVADVGATNARFALTQGGAPNLLHIKVLPCADYPSLEAAVCAYLSSTDALGFIDKACIAIAGTVHLPQFSLANNHWCVNKAQVNKALKVEALWVNDFTAQAWAMSQITPLDLMLVKQGQAVEQGNRLVMGPGTGIGVAGLVAHDTGWLPVMGEGGHVGVAPTNAIQLKILEYMWRYYDHVSTERLLSGPGMVELYKAVAHVKAMQPVLTSPSDILYHAQLATPDALAYETLCIFCDMLGNAVANEALTHGAVGGVYLTGGILPRMQKFLLASDFGRSFINKGRTSTYLQQIPIYLCIAEQPGLQGAVIALDHESWKYNVTA